MKALRKEAYASRSLIIKHPLIVLGEKGSL
jgi:hypothetical protein